MRNLFVSVGLLISMPIWGQSAVNLLYNPGFEVWDTSSTGQDSIPRSWHFFTRSTLCSGYVAKVDGYQGFGAKLVVIGDTSGYDASFYHYINRIDTLPFADDSFFVYIRAKENSANIGGRFYAYWQDSDGNIVGSAVSSSYTTNSPDWQEIYAKTVRPSSSAVTFKFDFRIYKYATSEDSIIVDDAYFGPLMVSIFEKNNITTRIPSFVTRVLPVEVFLKGHTTLDIYLYSADGKRITTLYSGATSGVLSMNYDLKDLKQGIYFVLIKSGDYIKNSKVIKL